MTYFKNLGLCNKAWYIPLILKPNVVINMLKQIPVSIHSLSLSLIFPSKQNEMI